MAINLSIKNVPDALADRLRARAERNHRSLQGELVAILESAVAGPATTNQAATAAAVPARKLSIDEIAAQARKLFPKGTSSSTGTIRAMRDDRYGEEWARGGQQPRPD